MDRDQLLAAFGETRELSRRLTEPLAPEDYRIQTIPEVSPPWWNLGHTTWFFAKNVLEPFGRYTEDDRRMEYCMNSYYVSLGPRLDRDRRGLMSRPTTEEVLAFRRSVDQRMAGLLQEVPESDLGRLEFLVTTGIHHEQQHQELLVTEIKHILGLNDPSLREPYAEAAPTGSEGTGDSPRRLRLLPVAGGLHEFGNLEGGWCFDNELAVHRAYLEDFALAERLVTNGEFLEFVEDGGYDEPLLWLSNGWARASAEGWRAPLYWERRDGARRIWTLGGERPLDPAEPVCHVSFYEADAFARWKTTQGDGFEGVRLPTEREWEHAARTAGFPGAGANFLESGKLHPAPAANGQGEAPAPEGTGRREDPVRELAQTGGDLWEWTASHYEPYPRYSPFEGALMEYNGKFMDNQRVLRGGSCATPESHIRVSYRNFWAPETRFQLTGIRLAKTLE